MVSEGPRRKGAACLAAGRDLSWSASVRAYLRPGVPRAAGDSERVGSQSRARRLAMARTAEVGDAAVRCGAHATGGPAVAEPSDPGGRAGMPLLQHAVP